MSEHTASQDDGKPDSSAVTTPATKSSPLTGAGTPRSGNRLQTIRWAIGLVVRPLLLFISGAALLALLGVAQRAGWITASSTSQPVQSIAASDEQVDWICPMMCTPPLKEPGRCPVCGMELVPAIKGGSGGDDRSIVVDAATRRIANIQTVAARDVPFSRTIHAVGELRYDERRLKTISAYTGGRFDKLYVDFTGAVVAEGEPLATFYSPDLYSAQVEFLQARKVAAAQHNTSMRAISDANAQLWTNARQRLIELGMSAKQIENLQQSGVADSRIDIVAPMSGTVIEKMIVEGEYVTAGRALFRLADLSSVWLMLELFPEDAASVRTGQTVTATVQSMPGRAFTGRVAFIDPEVNRKVRTVSVRVEMENPDGVLRVGDYAKAQIDVPLLSSDVVTAGQPAAGSTVTVVPRDAVLMAAGESLVYVEVEEGRFEIRRVVVGPTVDQEIVVLKGLAAGETVATSGNFLLDSQMQLAGNPSLIDPTRAKSPNQVVPELDEEMLAEIRKLPEADQSIAIQQVICPVTSYKLGSMGVPVKVIVVGKPVFLCCEGCRDRLLKDPQKHFQTLAEFHQQASVATDANKSRSKLPPMGPIEPSSRLEDSAAVKASRSSSTTLKLPEIGQIELMPPMEDESKEGETDQRGDREPNQRRLP